MLATPAARNRSSPTPHVAPSRTTRDDRRLLMQLLGVVHRIPVLGNVQSTAAVSAASVALGAVTGVLIARWLGPAARGELVIASVGPQFIGTLMILGTDEAVVYFLARATSTVEAGRVVG